MLDIYHVPGVGEIGNATQDIFYGFSGSKSIPWFKPRGKRMCNIFMLGGGSGGGSGWVGSASSAGGGGGGAAGGQTSLTLPLWALSDVMLVSAGGGGAGGVNGGNGGAAENCIIYHTGVPFSRSSNAFRANGASTIASAGSATGSASGSLETAAVQINTAPIGMLHGLMTTNINLAGQAGATGGLATNAGAGTSIDYPSTGITVSGGGGGGAIGTTGNGGAGGSVRASTLLNTPAVPGGIASAGAGGNGRAGYRWPYLNNYMMVNSGGSGGAGSAFNSATSGGNGGDGGYGCGGGGGGACLTGGVAGRGGSGGPGLVIITCW